MAIVFVGGASGIGKSTLVRSMAQELRIRALDFSDVMARHLPVAVEPKGILTSTSPRKRERARRAAAAELRAATSPALVAGHYGMAIFDRRGKLGRLEVVFPEEMVETMDAMVLLHRTKPLDSSDPDLERFRMNSLMEEGVFDYLRVRAGKPALKVLLTKDAREIPRLREFVARTLRLAD